MKIALLFSVALLAGCTYYTSMKDPGQPASAPAPKPVDQMCMSDCLGSGAERSFCTERCTK